LAHCHSETVGVCFGDLQSCAQGVASDPEGNDSEGQGEDCSHRLIADVVSLQADGLVTLQAVTVNPLSHADGGIDEQPCSSTAGDLETIEFRATTEADPSIARQGVNGHAGDCETASGEDFKHGSFG